MSPEQCQSSLVDRRSDLFSLGIVLYEMTTITRLFYGDNEFATMNRIVTKDVEPPSTRIDGYPPLLEKVVLRALRRDPAQRYQTGLEMQLELEHAASELGLVGSPRELGAFVAEICGKEPIPTLDMSPTRVTSASPPSLSTDVAAHPNPAATDETVVETRAVMPGPGKSATVGLFLAAGVGMLALSGVAGYLVARGNWGDDAAVEDKASTSTEETPAAAKGDGAGAEKAEAPTSEPEPTPDPEPEPPTQVVDSGEDPTSADPTAGAETPPDGPDSNEDPSTQEEEDPATPEAAGRKPKGHKAKGHKPKGHTPKSTTDPKSDPKDDDIQMRGSSPGSVGGKLEEIKDMK
jgi:hypothetical protein